MQTARAQAVKTAFDASGELVLSNPRYARQVAALFRFLFQADRQNRDASLLPAALYQRRTQAVIQAKSAAIIAGLAEIKYILRPTGLQLRANFTDGQLIAAGETLLTITGQAATILTYERTLLNILQRLSGIATATNYLHSLIAQSKARLAATRKTLWGWLDKRAVALGGGLTHRLGLWDAAMLKENHLAILQQAGDAALQTALHTLARKKLRFIEIEVRNPAEFWQMVELFRQLPSGPAHVIMFDHFTPPEISELIRALQKRGLDTEVFLEASGNITADTLPAYAACGVDVISVGAITHSPRSADFSLLIENV